MLHKGPAFQKRKDEKERVSVVGDRILSYLLQNPEAQDTLDGIVDWWLFEQTLRHEKSLVEKALSVLVGQGLLIATSGMDSRLRYKLSPGKRDSIQKRIADQQ